MNNTRRNFLQKSTLLGGAFAALNPAERLAAKLRDIPGINSLFDHIDISHDSETIQVGSKRISISQLSDNESLLCSTGQYKVGLIRSMLSGATIISAAISATASELKAAGADIIILIFSADATIRSTDERAAFAASASTVDLVIDSGIKNKSGKLFVQKNADGNELFISALHPAGEFRKISFQIRSRIRHGFSEYSEMV